MDQLALHMETPEERRRRKNRENMRRWRAANPDKAKEASRTSTAAFRQRHPERWRELHTADREKHREQRYAKTREWQDANPERVRELARIHRIRHIELARERSRQWAKENPEKSLAKTNRRRARKAEAPGSYTPQEWRELCASYGDRCLCCGRADVPLTIDHVVPLFIGGSNDIGNLQPLCKACNSSKGTQVIDYRPGWLRERMEVYRD